MRAIYENEIIGDPVYFGLMFGGELEFPSTDDFTKADWPGLRAIRVRNGALEEWILARDLPDDYEITVSPGAASVGGVPTGSIMPYAADTPPAGWLSCDGSAVSRTTYADLFGVIGTVWGVGDGSTTFNLPNLEDRFLTGAGNTYAIAATGGAATVTLATTEIPAHTHTGPSHTHTINPPSTATGNQSASHTHGGSSLTTDSQTTGSTSHTHSGAAGNLARSISGTGSGDTAGAIGGNTGNQSASHTHTVDIAQFNSGADGTGATGSTGGGAAHENRPPYAAVMFIILAASSSAGALVELYY